MSADRTHTVAKGSFNDIYLGEWLDNEAVCTMSIQSLIFRLLIIFLRLHSDFHGL